jgi:hypothetical protein
MSKALEWGGRERAWGVWMVGESLILWHLHLQHILCFLGCLGLFCLLRMDKVFLSA